MRGRLTQVEKSGHVGETGIIKLAFEAVSFNGRSYPMDASVVKANPQRSNRTTTKETVGKVEDMMLIIVQESNVKTLTRRQKKKENQMIVKSILTSARMMKIEFELN